MVRYPNLPQAVPSLAVEPPLNVLVMISSPSGFPALDVEQEMGKLETATAGLRSAGRLTLHRLESPTLEALQAILRRGQAFHVFHFVGHGGWDAQAEDGLLLLQDESGKGRPVTGEVLEVLLGGHDALRLAILNACEGARTSAGNPFAGVAQTLVRGGVPSVIAMQLPISDEAAIALSGEFYAALADGYPVDAALAEARKAIFARVSAVEWAIPVLYLRAVDGTIFDVKGADPAAHTPVEVPVAGATAAAAGAGMASTGTTETVGATGTARATETVGGVGTAGAAEESPTPTPQPIWRKYWWAGLIGVALVVILAVVLVQALGGASGFTRTSVPGVSTENHLNRVAAGSDLLVAVGQDGSQAAVWTSPDGTTWSEPEARLGAGTINMVIPVEQGFVAVGILGNGPEVWLSPDGGTWTHATSIEGPIFGGVKLVMNRVTAVGDRLFAVGFEEIRDPTVRVAAVWTSDDQGATWERVSSASFFGQGDDARMRDLEAGPNGVLVAVGLEVIGNDTNGAAWVSSDGGVTWTQDTLDGPQLGGAGEQNIATVVAGGPGFVAVGEDGDDAGIWTSTDGTRWRKELASARGGRQRGTGSDLRRAYRVRVHRGRERERARRGRRRGVDLGERHRLGPSAGLELRGPGRRQDVRGGLLLGPAGQRGELDNRGRGGRGCLARTRRELLILSIADQAGATSTVTGTARRVASRTGQWSAPQEAISRSLSGSTPSASIATRTATESGPAETPESIPNRPRSSDSLSTSTSSRDSATSSWAARSAISVHTQLATAARNAHPGDGPVPDPPIDAGISVTSNSPVGPVTETRRPLSSLADAGESVYRASSGWSLR